MSLKDAIQALNNRYAAVLSQPGAPGAASFFAKDADLLPPGPDNMKGPEAIGAFWAAATEQFKDARLTTLDVVPLGTDAACRGGWSMAHCLRALIVVLVLLGISRQATAQPVDLGIPNVPQETDVWCWAAVAEQIIRWRNLGGGYSQCELVSIADGFTGPYCCNPPAASGDPRCHRTGNLAGDCGSDNLFRRRVRADRAASASHSALSNPREWWADYPCAASGLRRPRRRTARHDPRSEIPSCW